MHTNFKESLTNLFVWVGDDELSVFENFRGLQTKAQWFAGLLVAGRELKGFLYLSATLRCACGQL
jgi:hypothetical protein